MLDLGFIEDIRYIRKILMRRRQTLLFSATINDEIKKLACSQVKSCTHSVMFVEMDDKRFFLEWFIRDYVQREGRTGRGMNKGAAISFCSSNERDLLEETKKHLILNDSQSRSL
jgi:superfamily II DNA/RNA helicase